MASLKKWTVGKCHYHLSQSALSKSNKNPEKRKMILNFSCTLSLFRSLIHGVFFVVALFLIFYRRIKEQYKVIYATHFVAGEIIN